MRCGLACMMIGTALLMSKVLLWDSEVLGSVALVGALLGCVVATSASSRQMALDFDAILLYPTLQSAGFYYSWSFFMIVGPPLNESRVHPAMLPLCFPGVAMLCLGWYVRGYAAHTKAAVYTVDNRHLFGTLSDRDCGVEKEPRDAPNLHTADWQRQRVAEVRFELRPTIQTSCLFLIYWLMKPFSFFYDAMTDCCENYASVASRWINFSIGFGAMLALPLVVYLWQRVESRISATRAMFTVAWAAFTMHGLFCVLEETTWQPGQYTNAWGSEIKAEAPEPGEGLYSDGFIPGLEVRVYSCIIVVISTCWLTFNEKIDKLLLTLLSSKGDTPRGALIAELLSGGDSDALLELSRTRLRRVPLQHVSPELLSRNATPEEIYELSEPCEMYEIDFFLV